MLLSPLSLTFVFLVYSVILSSRAIPLQVDNDSGILYRFSPASGNETDELLSWAEVRQLFCPAGEIISQFGMAAA